MNARRLLTKHRRVAVLGATAAVVATVPCLLPHGEKAPAFVEGPKRAMSQLLTSLQFYFYGRRHFTRTGWLRHSKAYPSPDPLSSYDLRGRAYVVTGANAGVGREITSYLAEKGARVYMVCRDQGRAEAARSELAVSTRAGERLQVVLGDVSLERDVRRIAAHVADNEAGGLDGLVCNAGALHNERTLTQEGVEMTFASHFLFGAYLLTTLLEPSLRAAAEAGREPRVVMVSSGGMYNTAFPAWHKAASIPLGGHEPKYDGQMAYAYAKRGQVLLCERWAEAERQRAINRIIYVSSHPGWTSTAAVRQAYGDTAKWLEPMRSTWEGAEGICWLCAAP
eukprot:CAMPEP_0197920038 /NCGR_PEP_ID=MMETSP1439-20131203/88211_1 /TAXON_ID=66791 /ORGANISM="Gonyaulax spinifera, Strain CCMP409" /LENGTH=336 /DNA_ID=CAMNT_0043542221 /DNA_START=20 /DNA_END=1027 /DNA_ORIENTATION=+